MSDQGAPVQGGTDTSESADGGQDTTQAQPDFNAKLDEFSSSLMERLEQFQDQNDRWRNDFEARFEPEPDDDDRYPLEEGDEGFDEQELMRLIDERAEQKAQERLAPWEAQQQLRDRDAAYDKLVEQYSELQDQKFAQPFVQEVAQTAATLGIDVETPGFVKLVELAYKAHVADKNAQQETPASERREVSLESGAGAAGEDREEDIQDRIIAAAKAVSPQI